MSNAYMLVVECETCGADMEKRVVDLTADPDEELRINVAMAVSQETWDCSNCGGQTMTSDFEDMTEHIAGEEPEGDEDE